MSWQNPNLLISSPSAEACPAERDPASRENRLQAFTSRTKSAGFSASDYRIGNVIFKKNGIGAIIDFDWSCFGPAQKDLALALVEWSYVDRADNGPNKKIFETFFRKYNKIAKVKFAKDETLFKWICFSCLSDTSTYLVDRIDQKAPNKVTDSYMYQKYLYFSNCIKNQWILSF